MKPLTDTQLALLQGLPDAGDGMLVEGSALMSADLLVRRNLARRTGPKVQPANAPISAAGYYIRTPTGAREAKRIVEDIEAGRVRRMLVRIRRGQHRSSDEVALARAVFGTGTLRGVGIDRAVAQLRGRGFTSVAPLSVAITIIADQEVAP